MTFYFDEEQEQEILRLYVRKCMTINSIATHFHVNRSVIERILKKCGELVEVNSKKQRDSYFDNYIEFTKEILEKYPNITASRVFMMAKNRGYQGRSAGHFRRFVKQLRPSKPKEAFARLATLPGEQGQVDWADFGKILVGNANYKLMAFVLTLSWSRAIFLKFFLSAKMPFFQQGFVDAFDFFGGIPKVIFHDNLKSGVLERIGPIIRYNHDFLLVAKHYLFEPKAVNIRRGNEKGRVERSIRYIRDNFFPGRVYQDLDDLNEQALHWCTTESFQRTWRRGEKITVQEAFEKEKEQLTPLPPTPFLAQEKLLVSIGKTPYARFWTNDYSVPCDCVGKKLTLIATQSTVSIMDNLLVVAKHVRSWEKYKVIENPEHLIGLNKEKKAQQSHSGLHRLLFIIPEIEDFMSHLAQQGQSIGGATNSLTKLLDIHGKDDLTEAIRAVLKSGSIHLKHVHHMLKNKEMKLPLVKINLDEKYQNITVKNHDLSQYDKLTKGEQDT